MKKTNNKTLIWCTASAVTALAVYLIIMALGGIYPFGENTVIKSDAIYQYVPFLNEFAQRIKDGSSLLYSWSSGSDFFGTICYYLLNPFNLASLLFKSENIVQAYNLIIILNTMAIAFSMAWYLQKHFKKSNITTVLFSLLYTFSGFYIAYYYNTMWLMALICLPIIALGIEKITSGGSFATYLIALTVCILSNFYLSYMICIFSVLYFFVCLFSQDINKKDDKDRVPLSSVVVKFGTASLFAGLLSATTLLPIIYSISHSYVKNAFNNDGGLFFNIGEFLRSHLPGMIPNCILPTESTFPSLMLGSFALLLIPMYIFAKNVSKNEKGAHIALIVFLAISFDIPKIYYAWHGMSAPAGLPYRFAFIYLFVLITMAYKVLENIKEINKLAIVLSVLITGGAYIYAFGTAYSSYSFVLKIGAVTTACSLILIALLIFMKKAKVNLISTAALVLTVFELSVTTFGVFSSNPNSALFNELNSAEEAKKIVAEENKAFSKIEFAEYKDIFLRDKSGFSLNTGSLYSLNGISAFSSLVDSDYAMFQFDMGCSGNLGNSYAYSAQTPVYNTLFDVGYVIDNGDKLESNPQYEYVGKAGEYSVYKSIKQTDFGILANSDVKEWDGYNSNPLNAQTTLWQSITGVEDVITMLSPDTVKTNNCELVSQEAVKVSEESEEQHIHTHSEEGEEVSGNVYDMLDNITGLYAYKINGSDFSIEVTFTPDRTQNIYLVAQSGYIDSLTVTKSESEYENTFVFSNKRIIDIGLCQAGKAVTVTLKSSDDIDVSSLDPNKAASDAFMLVIGGLDSDKYEQSVQTLNDNGTIKLQSFDEDNISLDINAARGSTCILPMPYDEGWTVTVDGEAVELYEHGSHMMMFDITQGEHTVEMKYFPQGLKEGIFVSVASLLALALVMLLSKVRKMKAELIAEEEANKTSEKPEKDD